MHTVATVPTALLTLGLVHVAVGKTASLFILWFGMLKHIIFITTTLFVTVVTVFFYIFSMLVTMSKAAQRCSLWFTMTMFVSKCHFVKSPIL